MAKFLCVCLGCSIYAEENIQIPCGGDADGEDQLCSLCRENKEQREKVGPYKNPLSWDRVK